MSAKKESKTPEHTTDNLLVRADWSVGSSAGSPVPEVSWFRDGQVLSAAALPGVQISFSDGRAVLEIPAVSVAHSGRYSVRATNGAGQATSTAELLVTGEGTCEPPR